MLSAALAFLVHQFYNNWR